MSISTKTAQKKAPSDKSVFRKQVNNKNSSNKQNSSAQEILNLHQTIGNQAVQRLFESGFIQGKLTVREPNDKYEEEADRVADEVIRMPESQVQRQSEEDEEEEMIQTKPIGGQITPLVQRQVEPEEEEEETVQTKSMTDQIMPLVQRQEIEEEDKVENRTGMPNQLKMGLEQLSGIGLSGVRVHKNSSKPAQFNALAYTQGQDIHVGPSQEKHLPHEGWHVVQQMQGRVNPTMQSKGVSINDDVGLENEADVMGTKALQKIQASQNSSNAKVPGTYSSDSSPGDKYVREVQQRVQEPQGKQLMAHPLAHVMQNSGGEVVQRTPAAAAWGVAEWLGAGALGLAVANEAVKSSSGDISWKLDEAANVLLPGGRKDVQTYQKENLKLSIEQKELEVSFWLGKKGSKKAGITFGLSFSTDGKGIGDISTRIKGDAHDWLGWGAICSVDLMPLSFVSANGKAVIRVTLTNSYVNNILGFDVDSGVASEVWHLEGDGTFTQHRHDKWMFVEHRLT